MKEKFSRALRPDAQPFDEIRIKTVPRYKESEMSGSEWRISATIEFLRKGRVLHVSAASDISYAAQLVNARLIEAVDNGKAFFAGEGDFCDQEGCSEKSDVTYRLKKEYCRTGHGAVPSSDTIRKFCHKHSTRGDCGLEDADNNYEAL